MRHKTWATTEPKTPKPNQKSAEKRGANLCLPFFSPDASILGPRLWSHVWSCSATPFPEGYKGCFPPIHAKDSRSLMCRKARGSCTRRASTNNIKNLIQLEQNKVVTDIQKPATRWFVRNKCTQQTSLTSPSLTTKCAQHDNDVPITGITFLKIFWGKIGRQHFASYLRR